MSVSRISTWIVAALAVGALSAACGGAGASSDGVASANGGSSAKNASAKNKADPQQAGLDFARCMREHGVDVPDPESGQAGFAVRIDGSASSGGAGGAGPSVQAAGPSGPIDVGDNGAFEECRHFLDDAIANSDRAPDPQMADRALKFAQCMRDHGVDMPDPQVNGGMVAIQIGNGVDPNSPTLQAAQEACKDLMGPPGGAGATKGGPGIGFSTGTAKS